MGARSGPAGRGGNLNGSLDHIAEAFTEGGASAALAASIFHFGQHSVAEAKRFLRDRGIAVRITQEV